MKRKLTLKEKKIISNFVTRMGITDPEKIEEIRKTVMNVCVNFRYDKSSDLNEDEQYRIYIENAIMESK